MDLTMYVCTAKCNDFCFWPKLDAPTIVDNSRKIPRIEELAEQWKLISSHCILAPYF